MADRIESLEALRMNEQTRLTNARTAKERNATGQFATPPALALEITQYVHKIWPPSIKKILFFEPALGTGSFYSAFLKVFSRKQITAARGVEVDPALTRTARRLWARTGLSIVEADFTELVPAHRDTRSNLIITNPPYVRHHHLKSDIKRRLQARVARSLGMPISGLSGVYCYFLLLAHEWLDENGIGAWLIPSEFMDVNYGATLRRYLSECVSLLRIHQFKSTDLQFEDALVSSAVVIFQKKIPFPTHRVILSYGGSLLSPERQMSVPLTTLSGSRKWSRLWNREQKEKKELSAAFPTLGDLFTIKRGIATGANSFFMLPRDKAKALRIPEHFLKPILPSPRHLKTSVIEADDDGYPLLDRQLTLIDCALPEHQLQREHPHFWSYLKSGKEQGISGGYLASRRSPWYRQEQRPAAPFLCTYMGREGHHRKPFRFLWNRSRATAANVYLLLYPNGPLEAAFQSRPELVRKAFEILEAINLCDLTEQGRTYGGGLHKLEPRELARVTATRFVKELKLDRNLFHHEAPYFISDAFKKIEKIAAR